MGSLRIKSNEWGNKEKDRKLKESFVNSINDDNITTKLIREKAAIKKANESTSE